MYGHVWMEGIEVTYGFFSSLPCPVFVATAFPLPCAATWAESVPVLSFAWMDKSSRGPFIWKQDTLVIQKTL